MYDNSTLQWDYCKQGHPMKSSADLTNENLNPFTTRAAKSGQPELSHYSESGQRDRDHFRDYTLPCQAIFTHSCVSIV